MKLTGSHELAIILNQLVYMDKWLSVSQIKRYCLSGRCDITIRNKLNRLVNLGFVEKRTENQLYQRHFYKAKPEIWKDKTNLLLVAMVDGYDMKDVSCYTEAEIINKLRQMVLDERRSVCISGMEIHRMIRSDKCGESIRLKLKAIEKKGFIKPRLIGRVYEYDLDYSRLLNTRTPEILKIQGNELTDLFTAHCQHYHKENVSMCTQKSWTQTFKRMLGNGYDIYTLRQIIAYLPQNTHYLNIIKSPAKIKSLYDELYPLAYQTLSLRNAKRYLFKLVRGLLPVRKQTSEPFIPLDNDWFKVTEWMCKLGVLNTQDGVNVKGNSQLRKWYESSSHGVYDVDLEDYVSQAQMFAYKFITEPPANQKTRNNPYGWLYGKLNDFMYNRRCVDKNKKSKEIWDGKRPLLVLNEGHLKNLLKDHNFDKDVSIIENLPVPSENSTDSFEDDSDDKSVGKYSDPELLSKLHEALKHLPEKDRALLIDYYCFDYVKRSYKELAKEHKVSVGYAFKVVKRSTEELKRILSPPDG